MAVNLPRLHRTVLIFFRSNKLTRSQKKKLKALQVAVHILIHDKPTRWNSAFNKVYKFCEQQQQAICAALAETDKDKEITILVTVRDVIAPLNAFTDAFSEEKDPTLFSVLPLLWKIDSCLADKDSDKMKRMTRDDIKRQFGSPGLQHVLNTAIYLHSRV